MKNDLTCALVEDLLPSYAEGLTSPETNGAVERHLAGCPACAARLAAMRAPEPEREETAKEVDYLKKVKRRGWKRVTLAVVLTVLVLVGALAAKVFVIGSPASADTMAVRTWTADGQLWVDVTSGVSANAYWGWDTEVENGTARITAREVVVSPIHPTAWGRIGVPLEGVEEVYLCGRLIWQAGEIIQKRTLTLYQARTQYAGDAPALGRIAQELDIEGVMGPFSNVLKTDQPPYGWELHFKNRVGDLGQMMLPYLGPQMLALVENLEFVTWSFPSGQEDTITLTLDSVNAHLPEWVDAYNASNGTSWTARESIKDYLDSPASFQQLLSILEHRYETRRMGVDDMDLLQ